MLFVQNDKYLMLKSNQQLYSIYIRYDFLFFIYNIIPFDSIISLNMKHFSAHWFESLMINN